MLRQSQRDGAVEPRVATEELPWEKVETPLPQRGCGIYEIGRRIDLEKIANKNFLY
jgi:hypothetical protein